MRTRRGLSTVVGAVFAVIVISTSIGYVAYSMNLLQNYNTSVLARNQLSTDKASEDLQLYSLKVASNKFNITVVNTGSVSINITRMWIQNTTATDWVNYYTINKAVNPGALITNIGQSSSVYANTANAYNIKLVTARGNSVQFSMGSTSAKPLFMQLIAIPKNVTATKDYVTMLYTVVNNMSNNNALVNLTPSISCTRGTATFNLITGPTPSQYSTLPNNGVAIFKWEFQIQGAAGVYKTCQASLVGGVSGNTVNATAGVG